MTNDGTAAQAASDKAIIERTRAGIGAIDAARALVEFIDRMKVVDEYGLAKHAQACMEAIAHHDAVCEPTPSMFGGFDH